MITQVMKMLEVLVVMAINLGHLMAQAEPHLLSESQTNSKPVFTLPCDVCTAMAALSIEPKIMHSICCPNAMQNMLSMGYHKFAPIRSHLEANPVVRLFGQQGQLEEVHTLSPNVSTAHKTLSHGSSSSFLILALKNSLTNHMLIIQHLMLCTPSGIVQLGIVLEHSPQPLAI